VAVAVCEFWFETTKTPLSLIVAPVSVTVTGNVVNSNRDRQEREERQERQEHEERQESEERQEREERQDRQEREEREERQESEEHEEREERQESEEHEERQECQSGLDGHQFHAMCLSFPRPSGVPGFRNRCSHLGPFV
jgi:hypothetical protein